MTDANTTHSKTPPFLHFRQSCADYRRGPGIGQGIAFFAGKARRQIVAVGRTLSKCEKTVADIEARFNGKAVAIECDISDLDALDALVTMR